MKTVTAEERRRKDKEEEATRAVLKTQEALRVKVEAATALKKKSVAERVQALEPVARQTPAGTPNVGVPTETIGVVLERAPAPAGGKLESYGFKSRQSANGAKYITDVFTPGLSDGKLKTNDVILCIGGRDATIIAHKHFTSILASSLRVTLTVERFHDMSAFQHRISLSYRTKG